MTRKEIIFTIDYGIKEMSFYCANDSCYVATFVTNDGEKFEFKASRAKVMEHIERTAARPELYMTNKTLVVSHFHHMAMAWYRMTHLQTKQNEKDYEE